MKALLVIPLLFLTIGLASCGDDESEANRAAYEADILDLQEQWNSYRDTINNNYDMVYIEEINKVSEKGVKTSRVRDGVVLSAAQGSLTMDRIYTALLSLFENDRCEIDELVVEEGRPVIKEYTYICGDTEFNTKINHFIPIMN
ncbi:MAG: hypothetical protein HRT44_09695 [Bdellovibrionales bacterium]|nr:hypothetical protein [Bdellovibrionales bacterium]NQZ19511.1 hypothetical protein [Bdellovibrionales bacterium]